MRPRPSLLGKFGQRHSTLQHHIAARIMKYHRLRLAKPSERRRIFYQYLSLKGAISEARNKKTPKNVNPAPVVTYNR